MLSALPMCYLCNLLPWYVETLREDLAESASAQAAASAKKPTRDRTERDITFLPCILHEAKTIA